MSGMKGQVYYVEAACPTVSCEEFTVPEPEDCWEDEVTRFTIVDSVQSRKYGHDKSQGWQDVCAGIRSLVITLDAVIGSGTVESLGMTPLSAGQVVGLALYPFGAGSGCNTPALGYAVVDQISYTVDQERGEPVAYTMTLSSKGPWSGLGANTAWGGFECACGVGSGSA
jgi:hypothetical protein